MNLYAQDIIASKMIKETKVHVADAETKRLICDIIQELRPKLKSSRNRKTFPALKDKIFNRKAEEVMKYLEKIKAKSAEVYVPANLSEEWKMADELFIKRHYYWKVYRTTSPQIAFVVFMERFHKKLWSVIPINAEKKLFVAPGQLILDTPYIPEGILLNKELLENEWIQLTKELNIKDQTDSIRAKIRVYSAYGLTPHSKV